VEGICRGRAMRCGVGQRLDDLHLLDDGAGPSVRDDHRQGVVVLRADVNEMNIEPVDLGDEVRQGVQLRLALAPVVLFPPIGREVLHRGEPHPLRIILDRFPLRPPCRVDAPAQIDQLLFWDIDLEPPYRVAISAPSKVLRQQTSGSRRC
jgi:hypothetical protein